MSNYKNFNNSRRSGGGYNSNPGYDSYRGGGSNNRNNYAKKSGASYGFAKGDHARPYVRGWKASKREGITTYMCSPYESKTSSTKQHTSKTGRVWENWACKVQPQNGQSCFVSCLF